MWEVQWVQLPEVLTRLPAMPKWKKLLICSVSPLCQLSKHGQESSTGVEKLCFLISLLHFGLRTNTH